MGLGDYKTTYEDMGELSSRSCVVSGGAQQRHWDYDELLVTRAWETLLEDRGDKHRDVPVRNTINDSWNRCASGGIDPMQSEAPISTDSDFVESLTHKNLELVRAARRPFEVIGRMLDGTGAMMVLADSDGVLIDAVGDKGTLFEGRDIHLGVGGKWTEEVVGTNGIGTALWTGEPVIVHAAEHFCSGIKSWTCAGAPIRDPFDGKIVGVVDLSGHPRIFRQHNLALVVAAAREIERALADFQHLERTRLLEAFLASAKAYRSTDSLIIVDQHNRAVYSNNMQGVTGKRLDGLLQNKNDTAQSDLSARLDEIVAKLPNDLQKNCYLQELKMDGEVRGTAIVIPQGRTLKAPATVSIECVSPTLKEQCRLIVGESAPILAAIDIACRASQAEDLTSVLIEGETGVGKELFARLIHMGSRKSADSPLIAVNCGAITKELFGSELFGHVAGAFTGALRDGKPGLFEQADGGLLCLDEIGEMPLDLQPFLLRVLEERVVHRLGESRDRPVDVKLVASTNRHLKDEVAQGRFRRDLYYRIGAVSINIPPLRERGDDVLLLIEHFGRLASVKRGGTARCFTNEALDALRAYRWPGNVRELRNFVEKMNIFAPHDLIDIDDLPADMLTSGDQQADATMANGANSFADAECQVIRKALAIEHGNLSRVAKRLGISRPTLYRKLDQFGIRREYV